MEGTEEARVAFGVKVFDHVRPDWRTQLDVKRLKRANDIPQELFRVVFESRQRALQLLRTHLSEEVCNRELLRRLGLYTCHGHEPSRSEERKKLRALWLAATEIA